jgi:hypothetical protein
VPAWRHTGRLAATQLTRTGSPPSAQPRSATWPEPGYEDPDGASIIDPDAAGPAIGFLRVPEAKTAKNKMHIDIRVAGEPPWDMPAREDLIRAKVAEVTAAGATAVRDEFYGEYLGHVVMLDPERNEFCVA